jgi:hypothetical protein
MLVGGTNGGERCCNDCVRDVEGSGDANAAIEPKPAEDSPDLGLRELQYGTIPTLEAAEGRENGVEIGVLRADEEDDWI